MGRVEMCSLGGLGFIWRPPGRLEGVLDVWGGPLPLARQGFNFFVDYPSCQANVLLDWLHGHKEAYATEAVYERDIRALLGQCS